MTVTKRRNDPLGLRNRVLDVAYELFQARGYHATSIQDVMLKAGVSGGALHHHFPTKKSIGLAVVKERVTPAVRDAWIVPIVSASSLEDGVRNAFRKVIRGIEKKHPVQGCPLNNLTLELANVDKDFRGALNAVFAEWQSSIADRIGQLGTAELRHSERYQIATTIVSTYSGAMTMAKAAQDSAPLKLAADSIVHWLETLDLGRARGF